MSLTSPIHRVLPHPTSQHIYLASSCNIHKYNLKTSSIDSTYTSSGSSYPQFICVSDEWIFFTGGDKLLHILNAHTLESVASFYLLKRASAITYDDQKGQVLVADKTGEVWSFPFPLPPSVQSTYDKIQTSLPQPDDKYPLTKPTDERFLGQFLLGHSSSIVCMTLINARWGRALVTGDRDEHIRISVYPETHIIHAMGLGHASFLSCVLPVVGQQGGIVSGAGDMKVISWDENGNIRAEGRIESGTCVRRIRQWRDVILVVGEGSSCVEVLKVHGLDAVQKIEVDATVLDVLVHEGVIYLSLDANEGDWIVEYRYVDGIWKRTETNKWKITGRDESKVELYYLEANRKKTGSYEDD